MALVLNDRVKETSTTQGTGDITLAGASTGFISFNTGIGTSNTTYYCIFEQGTNNFEIGLGTLSASTTLQRTTVIKNSAGNTSKIDFNTGGSSTLDVFCTFPANKTIDMVFKTIDMVLTTQGDVPYASAANTPARLGLGSAGQILQVNSGGTAPEWATSSGVSSGFVIAMSIAL
jgi:hypothetical protein